jgi:hypothetical protein
MRWVHISIRRTNAGRTRRWLLGGHGEGSAHVTAEGVFRLSECQVIPRGGSDCMMAGALMEIESMKYYEVKSHLSDTRAGLSRPRIRPPH